MKDKIYNLYRECFPEDSANFADYYIEKKFNGKNLEIFINGEEPVCMLFLLDNHISFGNKTISCPFITAVGTAREERKRGLARKLIMESFKKMHENGEIATSLYPEKHSFYAPLGFSTYAYTNKIALRDFGDEFSSPLDESYAEVMLQLYNKFTSKYYIKTVRTLKEMQDRIEMFLTEGHVQGYFVNGELKAYCMYFDPNDIEEVVFEDDFYVNQLGISTYRKPSELGRPEAMIRVLDVTRFFNEVGFPTYLTMDMKIKITDEILPHNNVNLHIIIKDGESTATPCEDYDIEYTLDDLTSSLLRTDVNVSFEKF